MTCVRDDKQREYGHGKVHKLPQWKLWAVEAEDNGVWIRTEQMENVKIRRVITAKD